VDRRQVYAWQHVQPSRTNRPCGLILFTLTRGSHTTEHTLDLSPRLACSARLAQRKMPVVLARGIHLVPSRTQQLSPSAPMVLQPQAVGE
jgi:hypothetical protein